jgi:hypothetical protein
MFHNINIALINEKHDLKVKEAINELKNQIFIKTLSGQV